MKFPNLSFLIIALIVGGGLYRQFDMETMTFENPALSAIYGVVFIAAVVLMIRGMRAKKSEEQ